MTEWLCALHPLQLANLTDDQLLNQREFPENPSLSAMAPNEGRYGVSIHPVTHMLRKVYKYVWLLCVCTEKEVFNSLL